MEATAIHLASYRWEEDFDGSALEALIESPPAPLKRVLTALQETKGQLTESDAASLLFQSSSGFRHLFKKLTGVTYQEVRLCIKLRYAADLLRSTDFTIIEVSAILQYSDRTSFEKSFKKLYKVTPTKYLKHHRSAKKILAS